MKYIINIYNDGNGLYSVDCVGVYRRKTLYATGSGSRQEALQATIEMIQLQSSLDDNARFTIIDADDLCIKADRFNVSGRK